MAVGDIQVTFIGNLTSDQNYVSLHQALQLQTSQLLAHHVILTRIQTNGKTAKPLSCVAKFGAHTQKTSQNLLLVELASSLLAVCANATTKLKKAKSALQSTSMLMMSVQCCATPLQRSLRTLEVLPQADVQLTPVQQKIHGHHKLQHQHGAPRLKNHLSKPLIGPSRRFK